jgi:ribonuclease E
MVSAEADAVTPPVEDVSALATSVEGSDAVAPAPRADNGQPREKRQRDRYGRDRGNRGDRGERTDRSEQQVPMEAAPSADAAPESVATPALPTVQTAPAATAATVPTPTMPKVTPYTLPTEALLEVAQQSGLQWVNSDAAKVQAIQAAIAAEPKPVHVPRERPAPVVVDEGPLVLVETKRDLRAMTLPFEETSTAP